jgi:tetratricopeptide (TPR) repeat protein
MVEIDKILSERSDERIIRAVKEISEPEFAKMAEAILGYLELKSTKSRPKGSFFIAECTHRPDGKKYVVFFSRRDDMIGKADVESLLAYMKKAESPNGLIFTTSSIAQDANKVADDNNIGLADGTKFAALLRRFDLDKEIIRAADLWKERSKLAAIPGADRQLEETMKAGYEALAARDYMKALDHFDHAIMLREDYDVPWRLKGNTLDEMGYHEQALGCYKRALELFPESDETWFSLGASLFALGRYNEEIVCYDRALQHNPVMQKALINKGSTLHRLGRYQEALDTFDKVLKINYRLEKVHNNRGATLHSMGKINEALTSYNRAIEFKHDYVEAWMNKGSLLFELGKYGDAFEAFAHMTQMRPELPKGWYLRGLAAKKTGNVSQAKASFEQALKLDPEYADAKKALEEVSKKIAERFTEVPQLVEAIFAAEAGKGPAAPEPLPEKGGLLGDVTARVREEGIEELAEEVYGDKAELLFLLGRLDEAFDFLGRSLRLEGENPKLLTAAGNVLYGLGRLEAACKTFENALAADPDYAPALFNLQTALRAMNERERLAKADDLLRKSAPGWQVRMTASLDAFDRGDYKQALEDVDVALTLENLAALENYRGLVRMEAGDLAAASESFEKTKSLPLDQSEACNNSGVVLLKKGELEKASLEFDRAIRLQRNNHAAWNNRGCVLYKVDRMREAIACYEESAVMFPTTMALSNKGFTQLSMDLLADAVLTYEQSLKLAETAEAFNNKGIVLERLGKIDDALVAFQEAVRVAPRFKDAQDNAKRAGQASSAFKVVPEVKPRPEPSPPGEEVIGDKEAIETLLPTVTESFLREKGKFELEAMCEALGLDSKGTRADLIVRILKAKEKRKKKRQ